MNKKQIWGSIDTPTLDYVIPKWETIVERLKDKKERDKASDIYDKIVEALKGRRPGEKFTVDKSEVKNLRDLALELEKMIAPCGLEIRSTGGTGNNKLYYTKAIIGDAIEAKLFGTTGNDKRGEFILEQANKNGVEIVDIGERLDYTREILLITPKGADDRIGAKFPYKEPKIFHDADKLIGFAKGCDLFYLESSLVKFLGKKDYIRLVDEVSMNGTKIIFAPPTDRAFFLDKEGRPIRDNIEALYHAGEKAAMLTMNETETVHYMGRPKFSETIKGKNDDDLKNAINELKDGLLKLEDKLALITIGKHGMTGITRNFEISVDAAPVERIVNTVGAGDSAAATVAAVIFGGGSKGFSKELVEKAMTTAAKVSAAVISRNPAQIDKASIKNIASQKVIKNIN